MRRREPLLGGFRHIGTLKARINGSSFSPGSQNILRRSCNCWEQQPKQLARGHGSGVEPRHNPDATLFERPPSLSSRSVILEAHGGGRNTGAAGLAAAASARKRNEPQGRTLQAADGGLHGAGSWPNPGLEPGDRTAATKLGRLRKPFCAIGTLRPAIVQQKIRRNGPRPAMCRK